MPCDDSKQPALSRCQTSILTVHILDSLGRKKSFIRATKIHQTARMSLQLAHVSEGTFSHIFLVYGKNTKGVKLLIRNI